MAKSLARNQAEMTRAFSRLLKMAAAEEGQEEQAEGDYNSAAEADPDDAGEEVEEDEGDADDQDIWASGKARRQERELQEVLAGQRILNANLGQIMQAVSGRGWGNVPTTALDAGSLIRNSSKGGSTGVLWKSADWRAGVLAKARAEEEDDGWDLAKSMSVETILSYAEAAARGVIPATQLQARLRGAEPEVRALFEQCLEPLDPFDMGL